MYLIVMCKSYIICFQFEDTYVWLKITERPFNHIDMFVSTNCPGLCLGHSGPKFPLIGQLNEREDVLVSSVQGSRD